METPKVFMFASLGRIHSDEAAHESSPHFPRRFLIQAANPSMYFTVKSSNEVEKWMENL
jgi:hypothetical protein